MKPNRGEQPIEPANPTHAAGVDFCTTRWTRVLEAKGSSPEAQSALSELCSAYYAPVFSFICARTGDREGARDLAQEFFARLLARPGLASANPERGRFRSFLLGAVKNFLADGRDRAGRQKRGGGTISVPFSPQTDTSPGVEPADSTNPTPDLEFDRQWGLALLARTLSALESEHFQAGKSDSFRVLKPWLTGDTENLSQADAARVLGMNEGAVKVAIHRLRRRFRELAKAEVAQTLTDPEKVDEELRHLRQALG